MLLNISREYTEIPAAIQYPSCTISLILPFEPKMSSKDTLIRKFNAALYKLEHELMEHFTDDISIPILIKLQRIVKELNYNTHTKTVAIFLSAFMEKVYYLNICTAEYISIDDSFEIRDIIYGKKQDHKYVMVVLGNEWSKTYFGNNEQLLLTMENTLHKPLIEEDSISGNIAGVNNYIPEYGKSTDKVISETDNGLRLLIQSNRLPLFVIGSVSKINQFKLHSPNAQYVVEYIPLNQVQIAEEELHKIMAAYVADWKRVKQNNLCKQIQEAVTRKKIFIGINDTWKAASQKKGNLLIIENDYEYTKRCDHTIFSVLKYNEESSNCFYIKNTVDEVIDMVLVNGGDVEFVDRGLLKAYGKMVLIEHDQALLMHLTFPSANSKLL